MKIKVKAVTYWENEATYNKMKKLGLIKKRILSDFIREATHDKVNNILEKRSENIKVIKSYDELLTKNNGTSTSQG